jgi:hypothetical protein
VAIGVDEVTEPGVVRVELPYTVDNLLLEPGTGLPYELVLEVEVVPAEE